MICGTHAALGAALGHLAGRRLPAFLLGVASHVLADLVPHRDYELKQEIALLAGALAVVAARYGVGSPAWYGALGGALPDLETGLAMLQGRQDEARLHFPTHRGWHGAQRDESWSQLLLALAALALSAPRPRKGNPPPPG